MRMAQRGRVQDPAEFSMLSIGSVGWRSKTNSIAVLVQEHFVSDQFSSH